MGKRQIKVTLYKKWEKWIESIEDEKVRDLAKNNSYITGGAIVSLLQGEEPNDLDIYFKDKAALVAVVKYYADMWNKTHKEKFEIRVDEKTGRVKAYVPSQGILEEGESELYATFLKSENKDEESKDKPYRPIFVSSNAITLSEDIQIIIRFYGTPDEVHKNFDFVHCTNYFIPILWKLVLNPEAVESLVFKELRYIGSKYPLASIFRAKKFLKRGWNINAGQYLKMALQLQNFNLADPEVLEEQLVGVDYYYFKSVIGHIREEKKKNPDFKIEETYIGQVIDKIYDGDEGLED